MADYNKVKEQICKLISDANAKTGKNAINLTDGVNELISGYDQSEDFTLIINLIGDGYLSGESGKKNYTDVLYEHFEVNKYTYPYVCISYRAIESAPVIMIGFAYTLNVKSSYISMNNGILYTCKNGVPLLTDDENYLDNLMELAISKEFTSVEYTSGFPTTYHNGTNWSLPCYVNYEQSDYPTCRYLA